MLNQVTIRIVETFHIEDAPFFFQKKIKSGQLLEYSGTDGHVVGIDVFSVYWSL